MSSSGEPSKVDRTTPPQHHQDSASGLDNIATTTTSFITPPATIISCKHTARQHAQGGLTTPASSKNTASQHSHGTHSPSGSWRSDMHKLRKTECDSDEVKALKDCIMDFHVAHMRAQNISEDITAAIRELEGLLERADTSIEGMELHNEFHWYQTGVRSVLSQFKGVEHELEEMRGDE